MVRRPLMFIATAAASAALLTGVAACGSSSDSSAGTPTTSAPAVTTTATAPATAEAVDVTLGKPNEFSLTTSVPSAPAGEVTFNVANRGAMVHEFVVIKTDRKADALPTEADGSAEEDGSIGEIADLAAGATASKTFTMTPGHYALICNLPGHYAGGMRADFTVS